MKHRELRAWIARRQAAATPTRPERARPIRITIELDRVNEVGASAAHRAAQTVADARVNRACHHGGPSNGDTFDSFALRLPGSHPIATEGVPASPPSPSSFDACNGDSNPTLAQDSPPAVSGSLLSPRTGLIAWLRRSFANQHRDSEQLDLRSRPRAVRSESSCAVRSRSARFGSTCSLLGRVVKHRGLQPTLFHVKHERRPTGATRRDAA